MMHLARDELNQYLLVGPWGNKPAKSTLLLGPSPLYVLDECILFNQFT